MDIKSDLYREEPITVYLFAFRTGDLTMVVYKGVDRLDETATAFIVTQPASKITLRSSEEVTVIYKSQVIWYSQRETTVKKLAEQPSPSAATVPPAPATERSTIDWSPPRQTPE